MYNDIEDFLCKVSSGALKLYIYYGFKSNNSTGDSWHSVSTISKALDVTPKTIENWNTELEEFGWIRRSNSGKKSKTTYLLPLSDFAQKIGSKDNFKALVTSTDFINEYNKLPKYFNFVVKSKANKFNHYYVIEVEKIYGKLNKRKIYYYYVDKSIKTKPKYSVDVLDDTIYKLPYHNDILVIDANNKPEIWFINDGIKLDGSDNDLNEIVALSQAISTRTPEKEFIELNWEELEV